MSVPELGRGPALEEGGGTAVFPGSNWYARPTAMELAATASGLMAPTENVVATFR
jgi:hypothetical protein